MLDAEELPLTDFGNRMLVVVDVCLPAPGEFDCTSVVSRWELLLPEHGEEAVKRAFASQGWNLVERLWRLWPCLLVVVVVVADDFFV